MYIPFKAGTVHLIPIVFYRPIEDISVPVNLKLETLQVKGMKLVDVGWLFSCE